MRGLRPLLFLSLTARNGSILRYDVPRGLDVIPAGYPASQQVDCESKAPTGPLEVADQPGMSGLSYDPVSGWYSYVWKPDKGWAGTCRSLALQLVDGTEHVAYFQFK